MSIVWGDLSQSILAGLLSDPSGSKYKPEPMLVFAKYALAEVSAHTSECATYEWKGDGQTSVFPLPSDMMGNADKNVLVALRSGIGTSQEKTDFLSVYKNQPETSWMWVMPSSQQRRKVYWAWPSNAITLGFTPVVGETLCLWYFKVWDNPKDDNSLINVPQWMEQALAYFIAGFALQAEATQAATIRQWNIKLDSGTPEDNSVLRMANWYIEQAHRVLQKYTIQDRDTFYRNDPRSPTR